MTASREPSNQSFEVDREATVCFASRRFFLLVSCAIDHRKSILRTREWHRGYDEINEFERMMVADGIRLAKCFLHITPAEQIHRFKDRLTNPLKRWKLSYEDFHNRARWADYEVAVEDMLEKT